MGDLQSLVGSAAESPVELLAGPVGVGLDLQGGVLDAVVGGDLVNLYACTHVLAEHGEHFAAQEHGRTATKAPMARATTVSQ